MEHVLIDLHNHIYPTRKRALNNLVKYFNNRNNTNEQKIFAITDHLQKINISEYQKEFIRIKKSIDKDIFLLPGLEINISLIETNPYKHLIIIFKDFESLIKFYENCSNDYDLIKLDNLHDYLKNVNNYFFVPHFGKSDKKRNFTNDEIIVFNKKIINNPIYVVEVNADYESWHWCNDTLQHLGDPFNKIHTIVGTDRILEETKTIGNGKDIFLPPSSYIYTNEKITEENAFDLTKNFFKQSNVLSKLSKNRDCDLTIQNVNLDLKLLNCVICGKRGSGKSFLLESIKMSIGEDSYLLSQFEFANVSQTKIVLEQYLKRQNILNVLERIKNIYAKIFNNKVNDITKCKTFLLSEISQYLENFTNDVLNNISKNLDDNGNKLRILKEHYNYQQIETNKEKVTKLYTLIDKLIDLKQYIVKNKADFIDLDCSNLINEIKSFFSLLIVEYSNEYKMLKIFTKTNELLETLSKRGQQATRWKYNFDFSLLNYFYVKNILEKTISFIHSKVNELYESNLLYKNNNFLLKLNLKKKDFNSKDEIAFDTPIITLGNRAVASEGEKSEFLLLSKLETDKKHLLLDEPEYSFDNTFICSSFTKQIIRKINEDDKTFFIITHNHVLWSEIFNKANNTSLILCERMKDEGKFKYKCCQILDIKDIRQQLISLFEANDDSYNIRKEYYGKN